jgi:PAS domain S-box-containing protein
MNHLRTPSVESLEQLFTISNDLLGTASYDGYFTLLNPAWEGVLGFSGQALMSQPIFEFVHSDDVDSTMAAVDALVQGGAGAVFDFENRIRTCDGGYRTLAWNMFADGTSLFFVVHDVTERNVIVEGNEQNVRVMRAVIENAVDGLYVADSSERITSINPAGVRLLGYDSADELVARSAHAVFHYSHPGGATFPRDDCPLARVHSTGHSVQVEEDAFWRKDGSLLPVSYSSAPVGLGDEVGSVVSFREVVALSAEGERQRALVEEVEWYDKINQVLSEDRFVLYAQPVIQIATGTTIQHELLLRMLTPSGDVIGPDLFLPVAEKFGLIHQIDRWVITQGIEIAGTGMRVAINLSAESMSRLDVLLHIERELARTGVAPHDLTFELTESAIMSDVDEGRRFADRLVGLGCAFALDDFGTGYASLTYLRDLPITYVKIDGRFVNGIVGNETDSNMVEAIAQMARTLGKTTIAEGIEDAPTLDKLRGIGVDLGQGFYIGRPGPLFQTGHAILTS